VVNLAACLARARRVARRIARPGGAGLTALASWLMVRVLLGGWVAAGLLALALVAALIAGCAAVEARVFDRPRSQTPAAHRAAGLSPGDHVAFARALTAVAAAYLAECERQDGQR
jgi:predicted lipid-binding transport protein (Tim44 family)